MLVYTNSIIQFSDIQKPVFRLLISVLRINQSNMNIQICSILKKYEVYHPDYPGIGKGDQVWRVLCCFASPAVSGSWWLL